jgi:hypothetical protein
MAAFPSYSTGTVSIAANATSVVGTGSNWSGQNAMSGDTLSVDGFGQIKINDTTDATHLAIDAWPFGAVDAGTAYSIKKDSPLRFVGGQTMLEVDKLVSVLNTNGFYVFVGPTDTVPDPSLGDDNQYALQATTGKIWQKVGGVWTFVGTFKGFGTPAAWDSATAYVAFDVVSFEGTSYVCIQANTNEEPSSGDSPPNAFWTVLAAKGDAATVSVGTVTTGAGGSAAAVTNVGTSGDAVFDFTIPAGEGYGGTSTTSLAIGTGSKAFTTQAGLAYTNGARVRASSAADTTNWMEGLATYSGTTLTITVTKTNGSGTHADWNLNVVGEPGAGDLSSANNLSDVASAATALANLGGMAKSANLSDVASAATALANLGGLAKSANLSDVANAATARGNLGLTAYANATVGQIPGTTGTTQPAAGFVGELISSGDVTITFATSATPQNITSITLTPGVWDIEALAFHNGNGSTSSSDWRTQIGTTSGSINTGMVRPVFETRRPSGLDQMVMHTIPRTRVAIAANTTYYLNGQATFSGGVFQCTGRIEARRVS